VTTSSACVASPSHARWLALLVAAAFFMDNLDATVIVTALPAMARSFGVEAVDLNVGITAYVLTLAVFIPASGWVAERFGHRRVFMGALLLFTLASVLCASCQTLWQFVLARALQAVGGAMMVPVGRLAVLRNTEKRDLLGAIALITWPGLVAPVLGPPLGGFITSYASWHWIFLLNVPFGLLALAFAWRLMPQAATEQQQLPFDVIGFAYCALGCAGLVHGLEQIGKQPGALQSYAWLAASAAVLWLLRRHLRTAAAPLLRLEALRTQTYAVTIRGGSLYRAMVSTAPFLLPLMFQLAFGLEPFMSGLLVLALFAGNIGMKPMTSAILRRFGFRTTLLGSISVLAATTFACAGMTPATPLWLIVPVLVVSGMARSMGFTAYHSLAFADVPAPLMTSANTLFSMAQQLGFGLGIALAVILLRAAQGWLGVGEDNGQAFQLAFAAVGLLTLAAAIDVWVLPANAGAKVSGQH
jgi:EmrB/QacA subfamily drug resistance transporter